MALTRAVALPEPAVMTPAASACSAPAPAASGDTDARRLSRAVARGDEEAFRQLYDAYGDRLLRLAMVMARGDAALARDVAQSVWLMAARKLKPLETDAHLWNWLALVARQQTAKALRRAGRFTGEVSLAEIPDHPAPAAADTLLEECLEAAVRSLEAEERRLVEWFYYERLTCDQVADRLGTTAKAISSRLERARAKLRSLVQRRLAHEA
ncbi:MAG TPA: sigma-70 family RNA polymerase sigma factor [Candidatus Paceibacterota bacterium]|nr:sigma-70 family RNA polymerase sigma factor [Candidatus Paceibacterota bacterium]